MKKPILYLFIIMLSFSCSGTDFKKSSPNGERYSYSSSSKDLNISSDKIDKGITYELFFTLEKEVKCLTVDINAVYIPETFPSEGIPKKTYFVIEKITDIEKYKSGKSFTYTQLAQNFNKEWQTFNPLQVCSLKSDPLSGITASKYRIRFTVFESQPLVFMMDIFSFEKITFNKSINQIIP